MPRIVLIGGNIKDWVKKGKRKDERQRLYDQLEKLWPRAVKITYGNFDGDYYYCEICGKPCKSGEGAGTGLGIASHHIEGKQSYTFRWLVMNGTPACSTCHTMGRHSAHQDRTVFINKMIEIRGQEWYDKLLKIKGEKGKWDIARMKKKKEELQKIIDS
jgi:hypothetical protein